MAHTLVRVELHGATTETQYQTLHRAMAAIGFERTIVDGNTGTRMQLPQAMYFSVRYATVASARDAAWIAASGTGLARAVVAAGHEIFWNGLSPA